MPVFGASYGEWKFSPKQIRARAQAVAACAQKLLDEHEANAYVVRGSSGTFMAGPVQMLADVNFLYVRKHGEQSHGYPIEGRGDSKINIRRAIVLDDFVSSGDTVLAIKHELGTRGVLVVAALLHHAAGETRHGVTWDTPHIMDEKSDLLGIPVYGFYNESEGM
jgi:hypoxanthine-guanine phosphoribosyltransferase